VANGPGVVFALIKLQVLWIIAYDCNKYQRWDLPNSVHHELANPSKYSAPTPSCGQIHNYFSLKLQQSALYCNLQCNCYKIKKQITFYEKVSQLVHRFN